MKKIVLATAVILAMASVAEARDRHHRGHHRHGPNWVPYAIGGAALGILGAGIATMHRPFRSCWVETRDVWDRWGNYRGKRRVEVCD